MVFQTDFCKNIKTDCNLKIAEKNHRYWNVRPAKAVIQTAHDKEKNKRSSDASHYNSLYWTCFSRRTSFHSAHQNVWCILQQDQSVRCGGGGKKQPERPMPARNSMSMQKEKLALPSELARWGRRERLLSFEGLSMVLN